MNKTPPIMSVDFGSTVNIHELCRLCGSKTEEYSRLNIIHENSSNLQFRIQTCLDIIVNETDQLPKFMCMSCANNLENFNTFKESCKSTQRSLHLTICSQIGFYQESNDNANHVEQIICTPKLEPTWDLAFDNSSTVNTENSYSSNVPVLVSTRKISVPAGQSLLKCNIKNNDSMITRIDVNIGRNINDPLPISKKSESLPIATIVSNKIKSMNEKPKKLIKRRYQCDYCFKTLSSKKYINRHIAFEHLNTGERLECTICNKTYKSKKILKDHITMEHEKNFPYVCDHCGKGFLNNHGMVIHIRSKHTNERPFSCNKCDKSFVSNGALQTHLSSYQHAGITNRHMCDICNKPFASKNSLKHHKESHTLSIEERRKHKCTVCSRAYPSKTFLHIHMRKHTGEKPYSCELCSNSYSTKSGLEIHVLTHTGEKKHVCELCGSAFALPGNLKIHKASVHEGLKLFKCDDCEKSYTQKSSLNTHLKKTGHIYKTKKIFSK